MAAGPKGLDRYTAAGCNPGKRCPVLLYVAVTAAALIILASAAAGLSACAGHTVNNDGNAAPELGSLTYICRWSPAGKVTLVKGAYREATAPGGSSELVVRLTDKTASGVIHGEKLWAAVLATSTGGSGTFYELALVGKRETGWINLDSVMLGDRVVVHSVDIADDMVIVEMTTHGPGEPMCCPTQEVTKSYEVQNGRIKPVAGRPDYTRPGSWHI